MCIIEDTHTKNIFVIAEYFINEMKIVYQKGTQCIDLNDLFP